MLQRETATLEALATEVESVQVAASEIAKLSDTAALGLSPEGGTMASTDTIQTMRASGGFVLPEGFKAFLPLILAFILVIFILLKK